MSHFWKGKRKLTDLLLIFLQFIPCQKVSEKNSYP